jgi:hypothetical protein
MVTRNKGARALLTIPRRVLPLLPVFRLSLQEFHLSQVVSQKGEFMNRDQVVADLIAYRNGLDEAIEALDGASRQTPRRGRPPKAHKFSPTSGRTHRTMSAAARKLISEAQKARWAAQKRNAAPKTPKVRRPMSAAARKKLSVLMKARWAARKS